MCESTGATLLVEPFSRGDTSGFGIGDKIERACACGHGAITLSQGYCSPTKISRGDIRNRRNEKIVVTRLPTEGVKAVLRRDGERKRAAYTWSLLPVLTCNYNSKPKYIVLQKPKAHCSIDIPSAIYPVFRSVGGIYSNSSLSKTNFSATTAFASFGGVTLILSPVTRFVIPPESNLRPFFFFAHNRMSRSNVVPPYILS